MFDILHMYDKVVSLHPHYIPIDIGSDGSVAQLVEHLTFNQRVLGSTPSRITYKEALQLWRASVVLG